MSKFCTNCGNEIPEGGDICLKCGKMVNGQNNNNKNNKVNTLGIVSLILSIIGFLTIFIVIGVFFGLAGLILSIISLVNAKKNNNGKGFAVAGLVISIITIIISIIYFLVIGIFVANSNEIKDEFDKETCGSGYSLTNGRNVSGSNEFDEWFCCPNGKTKNTRNCREY